MAKFSSYPQTFAIANGDKLMISQESSGGQEKLVSFSTITASIVSSLAGSGLNGIPIGNFTPSTGSFTTLSSTSFVSGQITATTTLAVGSQISMGLGTITTLNLIATNVSGSGAATFGSINSTPIGNVTPSSGVFTYLTASSIITTSALGAPDFAAVTSGTTDIPRFYCSNDVSGMLSISLPGSAASGTTFGFANADAGILVTKNFGAFPVHYPAALLIGTMGGDYPVIVGVGNTEIGRFTQGGLKLSKPLVQTGLVQCYSSDQVVNANTTLVDTAFTFDFEAGKIYSVRIYLILSCSSTGGYKFAITGTGTMVRLNGVETFQLSTANSSLGGVSSIANYPSNTFSIITSAGDPISSVFIDFNFETNTAGHFTLQFAQQLSNGTSTIKTGSCMQITKVN